MLPLEITHKTLLQAYDNNDYQLIRQLEKEHGFTSRLIICPSTGTGRVEIVDHSAMLKHIKIRAGLHMPKKDPNE